MVFWLLVIKGQYTKPRSSQVNWKDRASPDPKSGKPAVCGGSKIRIMPDVHAGAGSTIGTTMTITDKVVPNLVASHRVRYADNRG